MRITNGYGNDTRPYIYMKYKPIGIVERDEKTTLRNINVINLME